MERYVTLTAATLKDGITGEDRFKASAHKVSMTELHEADAVAVMIDGRVEVLKSRDGQATTRALPTLAVSIYPANNGGFLLRSNSSLMGTIETIIAACSDLPDLMEEVSRFYAKEDSDFAEIPDAGEPVSMQATSTVDEDTTTSYVVMSGTAEDPEKSLTIFYNKEVAQRQCELIWVAGGRAWMRPAKSY